MHRMFNFLKLKYFEYSFFKWWNFFSSSIKCIHGSEEKVQMY